MRVQLVPAYVLHRWPYRETSLLVEVLSRDHGRTSVVARGARRERSAARGLLQPFRPLLLSWIGREGLMTLSAVEGIGGPPLLGRALLNGLYLNELILRLVPRDDPHSGLYEAYGRALAGLARVETEQLALRRFELELLELLGYGMVLGERDGEGRAIEPEGTYRYRIEVGPVGGAEAEGLAVRGATLLALHSGALGDRAIAQEAKRLMRYVLQHYLGPRPLGSRALFRPPGSLSAARAAGPSDPRTDITGERLGRR
jgi:DNA repair protein RecO (recombination protein O)